MKTIIHSFIIAHFAFLIAQVGFAQIIHVPADQPTIQAGIDAATDGDTVLVADGIYLENINFNGKAITVASHFIMDADPAHIDNTVIDGSQPANPDYGSVVTLNSGEDTTSVICGFTITGGSGNIDELYSAREGGGIFCFNASASIMHNKITGNVVASDANTWGGGVFVAYENGNRWTVVADNTISGNHCLAGTGSAEGGGMEILGNARIVGNVISDNHCSTNLGINDGGGIFHRALDALDTLILINNLISNNTLSATTTARGGGIVTFYGYAIIQGNMITYNSMSGDMTNGGGILLREPVHTLMSGNEISYNTVNTSNIYWGPGCEVVMPDGPVIIEDNVFQNNTGLIEVNSGVGGGLAIMDAEENFLHINRNIFRNNVARFGGGYYSRSSYNQVVENNILEGNQARVGGAVGIYIPASAVPNRPVFINNTVVSNTGNDEGGAAHLNCETNLPIFFNGIFYGNSAPIASEINNVGSSDPITVSYCDINTGGIAGSWTGEHNFNADPGFIAGDSLFHLSLTSPCKNAGIDSLEVDGTVYFAPVVDFDGEFRPDQQYFMFDVGADERWDNAPAPPVALMPEETGTDYFIALWEASPFALGYFLDVATDNNFTGILPDYDNFDVGNVTSFYVNGLGPVAYYYRLRAYNYLWTSQNSNVILVSGVGTEEPGVLSSEFRVLSYPNPTRGISHFAFHISQCQGVTLKIYDLHGREVAVVLDQEMMAGEHVVQFEVSGLPAGMYFVRLQAGKEVATEKLVLIQ